MPKFEIEAHTIKTDWITIKVTAKDKDEAIQKAKDWEYDDIDNEPDYELPELKIDEVKECE